MALGDGAKFNLQDIQNSLYEFYLPTFRDNINNDAHYFYNKLKSIGYESISGKYAVYGLRKGHQGGAGFIADGADYKFPSTTGRERQIVYMKNMTVQGAIDLKTIHAGTDDGAFEDLLAFEMETAYEAAKDDLARQVVSGEDGYVDKFTAFNPVTPGSGTHPSGLILPISLTGTTPVTLPVENTDKYDIGLVIDIYDAVYPVSSATLIADNIEILDIDQDLQTIEVAATSQTTTGSTAAINEGDEFVNNESLGEGITGLHDAIVKDDNTYHGIDRTSNKWYKASSKDGGGELLTERFLRQVKDQVDVRSGKRIDMLAARHVVVQGYEAELQVYKQYNNQVESGQDGAPNLAGGYTFLTFDGLPFVKDRMMDKNICYGLASSVWYKPTYQEFTYDDFDGSIFKFTSSQKYNFRMYEFCNMTTDTPRANFVIENVSEDVDTLAP